MYQKKRSTPSRSGILKAARIMGFKIVGPAALLPVEADVAY